ncbi:MAG: hypothetical protein ABSG74_02595 [Candidatus Bathyarchaeia archaeon]
MEQKPYLHAELFRVDLEELRNAISGFHAFVCSPYFPIKAEQLFSSDWLKFRHLARLLELEGTPAIPQWTETGIRLLAFSKPRSDRYYPYGLPDEETSIYLDVSEKTADLNAPIGKDYAVTRDLLSRAVREKVHPPLCLDGWTIYDSSSNLTSLLSEQNQRVEILRPLQVHRGFSYQFRVFGDSLLMEILPSSRLSYEKSYSDLISDGWTPDKLIQQFPYAKIRGNGTQRVVAITTQKVSQAISDPPYLGRSFTDLVKVMYPNYPVENQDIHLVRTASISRFSGDLGYCPSTWAYPSLNYLSILNIDENYFSGLMGILRSYGRERLTEAQNWAARFSELKILDRVVHVDPVPIKIPYEQTPIEPVQFGKHESIDFGHIFAPPSITMKRYGVPTDIVQGVGTYEATVNDLLWHNELKPLDAPSKISVIAYVDSSLQSGWQVLKEALTKESKTYRGFEQIFGVKLELQEQIVSDFLGEEFAQRVSALPEQGYDCAVVIVPRHMRTPLESKLVYTRPKTMIMERGIPVQVLTNDPRTTFSRNATLEGKSKNNFTLFGISINILAKVGTILTAISESEASELIPDSLTIGYDVARIVPRDLEGVKTVPLSAPVVIFDNRGAYISHQEVYHLRNEVALFEQHGDKVFKKIPSGVRTLILHKNGYFTREELSSIGELSKQYGIRTIPVSIRSSYVPRVVNPRHTGSDVGLKAGTVLPLSTRDYLMVTTPFRKWDISKLGYPNPILITLHASLDTSETMRVLYHIHALTKMQTGSQRATRLPVSIHFANMIARFLNRVGDPNPTYLRFFIQAKAGDKYLPRWFV